MAEEKSYNLDEKLAEDALGPGTPRGIIQNAARNHIVRNAAAPNNTTARLGIWNATNAAVVAAQSLFGRVFGQRNIAALPPKPVQPPIAQMKSDPVVINAPRKKTTAELANERMLAMQQGHHHQPEPQAPTE